MTDEKTEAAEVAETDGLTPEETAYFESGGEAEIPAEKPEDGKGPEQAAESDSDGAKPEDQPEDQPDEPDGQMRDEKGRFVPHGALHAEREEHKKTRSELQQMREWKAALEERQRIFEEMQGQADKPEAEKEIDPNEDIFGAFEQQRRQLQALNERLETRDNQSRETQQQQQFEGLVWSAWDEAVQAYSQENPDYEPAAKWLAETRDKQLQAYAAADPSYRNVATRQEYLRNDLRNIVIQATRSGVSPAQAVYEIAKQWGYSGEASGDDPTGAAADKLEKLEKTLAASKTIGEAPGKSGSEETTAEALASMSEAEFSTWVSDPKNARKFQALMGG